MRNSISQHEKLKQEQERLSKQLEKLENDANFRKDVTCRNKIEEILKSYEKSVDDLWELFPGALPVKTNTEATPPKKPARKKRQLIRYTHPETSEQVDAKGLNNKKLQEWIQEHGVEAVKRWGAVLEDKKN